MKSPLSFLSIAPAPIWCKSLKVATSTLHLYQFVVGASHRTRSCGEREGMLTAALDLVCFHELSHSILHAITRVSRSFNEQGQGQRGTGRLPLRL
ncbi:hypothetical protein Syun_027595 [Stephania yunnanensis]|uniref:Uncharacterized protein n=1 Tax=Stephania yunnanensis TaxID=152371 RepID=A0AAP0HMY7_9MAGN